MYAVIIPVTRSPQSVEERAISLVTSFKKLTPNITGIARKNENSAAIPREQPRIIAPSIVEPERDVPGIREST